MAQASYAVPSFLGGEISAFSQGRFDKPDYRVSMRACLNAWPVEIGAWTRRPGTMFAQITRFGRPGRVMRFDFTQAAAVTPEFTDGFVRFRAGARLLTSNDSQNVLAISTANPAVMQIGSAVGWPNNATVEFGNAATAPTLLHNRLFFIAQVDPTHFSLFDQATGGNIDGAVLDSFGITNVSRIQELVTPYVGDAWASIRSVQAEKTNILLAPTVKPQALTVTVLPTPGIDAQFALNPAVFNDGPYLDPFTNGVQATPSAKSGIITLALAFAAYDAAKAYRAGDFVTSAGVNYISLVDHNVGSAPPSGNWSTTSAQAAINDGRGFLGTDVGRLVRLFSEPPAWNAATAYAASTAAVPVIVGYNPSGEAGATVYYQSLVASTGKAPGTDLDNWKIVPQAAIWSWGKITGLSNLIDRALAGSVSLGDMTGGGGIVAPFNGVFSQTSSAAATANQSGSLPFGGYPLFTQFSLTSYVGKNYSGASDQKIQSATVYPSTDLGFAGGYLRVLGTQLPFAPTIRLNLRGKASAPANAADGTLLGTAAFANSTSAVTIQSSDIATAWKYVWIEIISTTEQITTNLGDAYSLTNAIGQISFFGPPGTGTGSAVSVEILGPPLLYTAPIATWRLGVYSDTTGWPTCGLYNDGRLYLGGAVGNRFDASVSNGIDRGTINFAPTNQYGVVATSSAISYTFNSDGVNPILWMNADLQGIKMGTQAGEWLVVAPTAGSIAPNNISARNVTDHGSANIQPCRTEHTTVFVQRFARKLLEYFPDVYSGKFSAPNLADKAEHLTNAGVAELAYTSATTPIIWVRDENGALKGITYKRDTLASAQPPTYYGWHRHALGSDRTVESICAGPSVGGDLDSLTMVTSDSSGPRHVEILTDAGDETTPLSLSWFLDDAISPSTIVVSATGATLNGLWHLNGKTVQIFAGGLDCGDRGDEATAAVPFTDFVVANGSVFVPFGDSISAGPGRGLFTANFLTTNPRIVVGFTYDSDGQLMRMIAQADTGARNGPAFGALSRMHRYMVKLVNTLGLSVGSRFDRLLPCLFKTEGDGDIPALTSFTGIHQDSLEDDDSYDNALCWRISRPFPATITAIGSNLATKDQ